MERQAERDSADEQRRGSDLDERGERRVRPGLDDVDHPQQEHRPGPELEYAANLDWRRDVADAEVVALAAVIPYGDCDHGG